MPSVSPRILDVRNLSLSLGRQGCNEHKSMRSQIVVVECWNAYDDDANDQFDRTASSFNTCLLSFLHGLPHFPNLGLDLAHATCCVGCSRNWPVYSGAERCLG